MGLLTVRVSYGCCNKTPWARWHKIPEINCLTVLRLEVQDQGLRRTMLPLKPIRENRSSFWQSAANPWHSLACSCDTAISASIVTWLIPLCVCVSVFFSFCFIFIFKIFYLFIFRQRGREGKKHKWVAFHTPPTGDLACNPGVCPDRESNWWPFSS